MLKPRAHEQLPLEKSRCDSPEIGTEVKINNPMATWNGLPPELRGLILERLAFSVLSDYKSKGPRRKAYNHRRYGIGRYAIVCKQWQDFVEKLNFRSLEINSVRDLGDFDTIMKDSRRRSLLRRLSLCIELPRYPRLLAKVPETDDEMNDNEIAFTQGIWSLFDILSKWTLPQGASGIELELSAASPSDRGELFGEAGVGDDNTSRFFDHDLDFTWVTAGCEQVGRHGLPEVFIVSSCQILRRNHRNFSSQALLTIYSSLPQLQEIRYEPWHQVDMDAQIELDSDYARTLPFYPSCVKRISIFEHFDAFDYDRDGIEWEDADSSPSSYSLDGGDDDDEVIAFEANNAEINPLDPDDEGRVTCPSLNQNLGWLSLQTTEMSVSNLVDAVSLFSSILSCKTTPPVWTNLQRLTLTDYALVFSAEPEKINNTLHLVAVAAKQMPMLKMLELYRVEQFNGAVFRYTVDSMSTTACWVSTWDFRTDQRVRSAWANVASKNTSCELEFLPEVKLSEYHGPYMFINENLKSKDLVVHPTSLKNMLSVACHDHHLCDCPKRCACPKTSATGTTPALVDADS